MELELQSDPKQEPIWHPLQLLYMVRALKPNAAGSGRRTSHLCAVRQVNTLSEDGVNQLTQTLNREFERLFEKILQLDAATIRLEHDPLH